MQNIFRADTDTDTIFVISTDTVSVDGYLYPPDPDFSYEIFCAIFVRDRNFLKVIMSQTEFPRIWKNSHRRTERVIFFI